MSRTTLIVASLGLTAAALAGIGALHTPAGLRWMAAVGVGCPAKAAPAEVEAARKDAARAARGIGRAPVRHALGFELDRTTRGEVLAWAARHGVDCGAKQANGALHCRGVPASLLGDGQEVVDDLSFAFDPADDSLVTVTTFRRHDSAPEALATMARIRGQLAGALGPGREVGEASIPYLNATPLGTALVEYRYQDYIANLSVTNLGSKLMVREHYMSALD
jgi:hypothetical protein